MKSPTSIVNTLLESDYADYDPSMDPFSDPKNVSDEDLGYVYISEEDMVNYPSDDWHWRYYLMRFGLITLDQAWGGSSISQSTLQLIESIDKIRVRSTSRNRRHILIEPGDLTTSAAKRVTDTFGPPDDPAGWSAALVSVEYK